MADGTVADADEWLDGFLQPSTEGKHSTASTQTVSPGWVADVSPRHKTLPSK